MAETITIIDSSEKGIYIEIEVGAKRKMLTYPIEFTERQILSSVYAEIEALKNDSSHTILSSVNKGKKIEISRVENDNWIDNETGDQIEDKYKYEAKIKK